MKKLIVLCGKDCGYCKKAKMLIKRALEKEPKYIAIDINYIPEQSQDGIKLIHTLVPAFFCDNELYFEGNPDMDTVISTLEKCYK